MQSNDFVTMPRGHFSQEGYWSSLKYGVGQHSQWIYAYLIKSSPYVEE